MPLIDEVESNNNRDLDFEKGKLGDYINMSVRIFPEKEERPL